MKTIQRYVCLLLPALLGIMYGCAKNEFEHGEQNPAPFEKKVSIDDIKTLYKDGPLELSSSFYMEGIVVGKEANSFHLQEKAESGIRLNYSGDAAFSVGDRLRVMIGGKTLLREGEAFVLQDAGELTVLGTGAAVATRVTVKQLKENLGRYASTLLSLERVRIHKPVEVAGGTAYDITDETGTIRSFLPAGAAYSLPDTAAMFSGVLSLSNDVPYLNTREESDIQEIFIPPTLAELIMNNTDLVKSLVAETTTEIAPGVKQVQVQYINSADLATAFTIFEVDLNVPDAAIEVGMPDDAPVFGKRVSLMDMANARNATIAAQGRQVIAGITGDFWSSAPVEPFGPVVKDGVELKAGFYDNQEFFGVLKDRTCIVGDKAVYDQQKQNLQQAIGGRAILLNGEVVDQGTARDARPAIGYAENKKVYLFIGDGRQPDWSNGVSTVEMARIFQAIGAHSAVYMAGGNSAMAVARNTQSGHLSLITRPSGPLDAWIINSWLVTHKN